MNKYYPSAKSIPLGIVLWGILFSSLGLGFYSEYENAATTDLVILSVTSFAIILFVGIIWFRTGYLVSKDQLIVKIGPVKISKINISSISKISRSTSILASPANSFARLAIMSDEKVLVRISPKDEESFLALITEMNPNTEIDL